MASNAAASGTGYYAGHAPRVDAVHVPIAAPKCATVEDLVALSARRSEGGAAACEGDAAANAAAARPVLKSSEWNALSGSWHWEERDETAWLLSTLQSRLLALAPAEGRNGASARVTSVEMEDGGHAEVCVRKAKKIVTFELALTIAWAGECESGRGVMRVSGKQRLADVVEDDGGGSDSSSWTIGSPSCEIAKDAVSGEMDPAAMDRVVRKQKLLAVLYKKKLAPRVVQSVSDVLAELRRER
jgi:hypothetical protein